MVQTEGVIIVCCQDEDRDDFNPHRKHSIDAGYCCRRSSVVCVLVCVLDTAVSPAKTAESIEMMLGDDSRTPTNHLLDEGQDFLKGGGHFVGEHVFDTP